MSFIYYDEEEIPEHVFRRKLSLFLNIMTFQFEAEVFSNVMLNLL